jgi:hypothetical protein
LLSIATALAQVSRQMPAPCGPDTSLSGFLAPRNLTMLGRLVRRIGSDAVVQMAAAVLIGWCGLQLADGLSSPSRLPAWASWSSRAVEHPGVRAPIRAAHPDPAVRLARRFANGVLAPPGAPGAWGRTDDRAPIASVPQ